MSLTDPLSDMLTRIRNGQKIYAPSIETPGSNLRKSVLEVLQQEGYIERFTQTEVRRGIVSFQVVLKYHEKQPVIHHIQKISKPGRRVYAKIKDLPLVYGGLGIAILSTSRGVLSDREARAQKVGGEVLCHVF